MGSRWIFTQADLENTPSRRLGMSKKDELTQRQITAALIRKIGKKLSDNCRKPSSLSINSAMVYMHRFYMFHPFQKFPPFSIAPCALFLAAKVEETPLKLQYVIKTANLILNPKEPTLEVNDETYTKMQNEIIANENLLLQTLGFDLDVYHSHTKVISCSDYSGIPDTLTRYAYELATNSLHFTTMCLEYNDATIACICIHLASRRMGVDIGQSVEGKYWWSYLDSTLDMDTIKRLTHDYLDIIEKCKSEFNKWMTYSTAHISKKIKSDNH